jgi:aryl-alcohol dehydrogenase-like predicted oxidoreductase
MTMPVALSSAKIGLGLWAGDGPAAKPDPGALERLLWHAVATGTRWVDTAHSAANGIMEERLGACLATLPADARPAVMTKAGIVHGRERGARVTAVLHPLVLRRQLESSLQALRLEAVDTFFLHAPDETGIALEESWAAAAALADEGKTLRLGLCGFSRSDLLRCEAVRHVDVYLARLSPLQRDAWSPVLDRCARQGTEVIAWISGDEERVFDPTFAGPLEGTPYDRPEAKLERLCGESLAAEMTALAVARDEARAAGIGIAAAVSSWLLGQPGVVAVAVGTRSGRQLDRWVEGVESGRGGIDLGRISAAGRVRIGGPARERIASSVSGAGGLRRE